MSMLLAELLAPWVERKLPDLSIQSLCLDSRQVKPGALFFALQGSSQDGRAFIDDAILRGAIAIAIDADLPLTHKLPKTVCLVAIPELALHLGSIAERFYQYPSESLTMFGVTGTNGKTSVTYYLAEALTYLGHATGIVGTTGNGLWPHLQISHMTTPSAIELAACLADLVNDGAVACAMEVSSHALVQYRADGVRFHTVIFTNFTRDHLDYHQTMEAYAKAKQRLFDFPDLSFRVFNTDDALGATWARAYQSVTTYTYGLLPRSESSMQHTFVTDVVYDTTGMHMLLHSPWYEGPLHLNLLGQFNILNALAVFVALCLQQHPVSHILKAMNTLKGAPGRMQCVQKPNAPLVVIDYAHTPDALAHALEALRMHTKGKIWCVFGCGGDRDKGKRPLMAQAAEQYSDTLVLTSDNPRGEDPKVIIDEMLEGLSTKADKHVEVNRAMAIHFALAHANRGDVILIAGKGHETYQEIHGEKIPYQDLEAVEQYFQVNAL